MTGEMFTARERAFLRSEKPRLARLATVGRDGTPHVVPTGWRYTPERDAIEMGGHNLTATKKFRDVERTGRAAVVIDEVLPPWHPRGIEVRGGAEAIRKPEPLIRIQPERVVSWGLESDEIGVRHSRRVGTVSDR